MADLDINGVQKLVQDAIDRGATTVEDVHKQIANMPLDALANVGLGDAAKGVQELVNASIGNVYDTIRQVNEKVGEVAQQLLSNMPGGSGSKAG